MLTNSIVLKNGLNECLNPDGSVKPIYRGLMDSLETLGVPELRLRWQTANDRASMDAFTFLLDPKLDFTHFKQRKRERLQLNGTG